MKNLFLTILFISIGCISYGQTKDVANKEAKAMLQLKQTIIKGKTKTNTNNNINPKTILSNNKAKNKSNNVAVKSSMRIGKTHNQKNVNVYIVKDSKMEIVKTKPIKNKKVPEVHLKAMKAALGINQ